jgi:hypothetical protein
MCMSETTCREGTVIMTRKEKCEVVDHVLDRYERLGAMIVDDDDSLCRLLNTLELGEDEDQEIGDYLRSFLVV